MELTTRRICCESQQLGVKFIEASVKDETDDAPGPVTTRRRTGWDGQSRGGGRAEVGNDDGEDRLVP